MAVFYYQTPDARAKRRCRQDSSTLAEKSNRLSVFPVSLSIRLNAERHAPSHQHPSGRRTSDWPHALASNTGQGNQQIARHHRRLYRRRHGNHHNGLAANQRTSLVFNNFNDPHVRHLRNATSELASTTAIFQFRGELLVHQHSSPRSRSLARYATNNLYFALQPQLRRHRLDSIS